jgi:hypothetical protein
MAIRIILDIDVENPEEVIKAHKGQLVGLLSDVVLSKETKKKRVNKLVAEGIVDVVRVELPKELEKEMIKAKLHYQIIENVTFVE